jgi:ubiquinone/menaquinone biosynthesis C-methylase UbiE
MPKVAKFLKKNNAEKILDLGCGAGRNLVYLVNQGFEVYGLDSAKDGLSLIKSKLKKNKNYHLNQGSFYSKLPYKDNFFDAVISIQSLQHGIESKIKSAIKEIERVLKPDGIIFITLCGYYTGAKKRPLLVKTAKKIAERTYVPTEGHEKGLPHFLYNQKVIRQHFRNFKISSFWKDKKDYYCFIAKYKKDKN